MKVQLCRDDFYLMFDNALLQAGGGDTERFKKMTFRDVVDTLAQNGIRMVYMPDRHMDSIHVEWKPVDRRENPSGRREDGALVGKSLLCDNKRCKSFDNP